MLAQTLRTALLCIVAQCAVTCARGLSLEKPPEDGLGKVNVALTLKIDDEPVIRRLFENLDRAMTVGDLKSALSSTTLWAPSSEVATDDADSSELHVAIVADATEEELEDDVTLSTLLEQQEQQQRNENSKDGEPQNQVEEKGGDFFPLLKQGFLQGLQAERRAGEMDAVKLTSIIRGTAFPFSKDFWRTTFSTSNFFKFADTFLRGRGRMFRPLFCFCPPVKAPVCGVDGVTYANECLLRCRQVKLNYVGSCRDDGKGESDLPEQGGTSDRECACPLIEQPVCGTDGKTYANKCVLNCLGKTFAHEGKCSEDQNPEVLPAPTCPTTVDPVCGMDDRTYKNSCLMRSANVQLKHTGQCTEEELLKGCGCSSEVRPVCGEDGKSYMNKCLLDCHGVGFRHDGPCHLVEDNCGCPIEFKPVCGTDGQTYVNECTLTCKGTPLAHRGECARWPDPNGPPPCPSDEDPVCGSDGITYLNRCWASTKNVQVAHKGKCEVGKDTLCACPNTDAPVCGADGVTYKNRCYLDCANVRLAALGRCTDLLCKCSKRYEPVCGANGVTYRNSCYLRCNGAALAHKGPCRRPTPETQGVARALSSVTREVPLVDRERSCPTTYDPVCGQDGKTYKNLCELERKDVGIAHYGECTPEDRPCECTREWDPVCATNGKTYPNICLLHCDDAVLKHKGKCTKKERKTAAPVKEDLCVCPRVLQFVCGADGKTYDNLCSLKCSGTKLFHYGKCDFKMPTNSCALKNLDTCVCPDLRAPVCGVDGKTYGNECELNCACVALAHFGECKIDEEPKCACPETEEPVCGRDGKTYQNECLMKCADTALRHAGPCSNSKQPESVFRAPKFCGCSTVFDPVCGSDGKTYANRCLAQCHAVTIRHPGKCRGDSDSGGSPPDERLCPCPRVLDPVCGADGKTYNNRCLLKCQQAEFVHYGECAADRQCGNYSDPVCGVNDKTYTNDCLRHKDGVLLKFRRPCLDTDDKYVCYCPTKKAPVCGRDGKTYRNECEMECRGVELDHQGKCECPCPRNLDPVCGSDGKTYNNKCLLDCEDDVQFLYYGKCTPNRTCPDTVNPVCGTNGKTYVNDCLRYRAGTTLLERDSCHNLDRIHVVISLPNCPCPTHTELVCGKDGRTYINKCVMRCARVQLAHSGRCQREDPTPPSPKPPRDCPCPAILDPVCASDGTTYKNKCLLECEGQAKLLYFGSCVHGGVITNACPDNVSPVCGTNGKTYANDCLRHRDGAALFERDFCRKPVDPTEVITMVQNCPCPTQSDLVCGKDGRTYFNECVMKYAQVELAFKGKCGELPVPMDPKEPRVCRCPRVLDPVCGSDGKTYNNKCLMDCQGHILLYYGKCGPGGVCPTGCPDVTDPVCSTSGKTYKNDCFRYLDGAVLKERNRCPGGTAIIVQPVFCECPRIVDIVCGRDYRVYINQCEMQCRQVSINHTGKCVTPFDERFLDSNPFALCTTEYLPVCGVNGLTYGNKCVLEAQNVALSSEGPCRGNAFVVGASAEQQVCRCPRLYRPVCGVDGNTYPNECVRECHDVVQKHEGQCEA